MIADPRARVALVNNFSPFATRNVWLLTPDANGNILVRRQPASRFRAGNGCSSTINSRQTAASSIC
jgi:hypothetical protein